MPPDAPHVSAGDRGLTLADGLFETMRSRNGRIFKRDRHLARLTGGLAVLGIPVPPSLEAWIDVALASRAAADVRVRVTVTRGDGPPGLVPPPDVRPTVIVAVTPLSDLSETGLPPALALHVASGRRNERAMTAGLKTLSYTDGVMAMLEARRHGADDALLLDTEGHCSETTACNVFICTAGTLTTPPTGCGALPGITRGVVLELASAMGMACGERPFDLDALLAADEVFVTNSTRGPVAVGRIGNRTIGRGEAGPCTRRLADAWRAAVLRECR
jgi:branched-chain amino acid aminotransferase